MLPFYLVAVSSLFAAGHGYVLDTSCDNYKSMLEPMIKGGFDLAQAGVNLMNDLERQSRTTTATLQAKKQLLKQLFPQMIVTDKKTGQDTIVKSQDPYWTEMKSIFTAVGTIKVTPDGSPSAPPAPPAKYVAPNPKKLTPYDKIRLKSDWKRYEGLNRANVVIFCGTDRFEHNERCDGTPDFKNACDRSIGAVISVDIGSGEDAIESCNGPTVSTQAFTHNFGIGPGAPSLITLCEPWLKRLQGGKIKTVEDARALLPNLTPDLKKELAQQVDKTPTTLKTEVDLATSAGDFVMLHELTHAIYTAEDRKDVKGSSGSYGWNNVLHLSKTDGLLNADNYAFFGFGARLISPKTSSAKEATILDDGVVELIANPDGPVAAGSGKNKRDDNINDQQPPLVKRVAPADADNCVYTPANGSPVTLPGLHATTVSGKVVCAWTLPGAAASGGQGQGQGQGQKKTSSASSASLTSGGSRSHSSTPPRTSSSASKATFAHVTITSASTTVTPIITVVPIVSGKLTTKATYTVTKVSTSKGSKPTLAWGYWGPPKFKPSVPCIVPLLCPDKTNLGFPKGITGPGNKPPNPPPPPPDAEGDDGDDDDDKKSKATESDKKSAASCSMKTTKVCDSTLVVSKPTKGSALVTSTTTHCRTQTACTPTIKASTKTTTVSCSAKVTSSCSTATHTMVAAGKTVTTTSRSCQTVTACNPSFTTGSATQTDAPTLTAAPFVFPYDEAFFDAGSAIVAALATGKPATYTFTADGAPASASSKSSSTHKSSQASTLSTSAKSDPTGSIFECTEATKDQCSPAVVCNAPEYIACVNGKCVCNETPPKAASSTAKTSSSSAAHSPSPPPSTKPAPTTASPPYATGTCTLSMTEYGAAEGIVASITVEDNKGDTIATFDSKDQTAWQHSITIPAGKLKDSIVIDFLDKSVKKRSAGKKRMIGGGTPGEQTPPWMAYGIQFTVGSTTWTTADTSGLPSCSVGSWNGELSLQNVFKGVPTSGWPRDVKCKWKC